MSPSLGIGLAVMFHFQPVLGGLLALIVGTLMIWGLERQSRISTETVTGVVFSLALAVGTLLANGEELVEALLGAPSTLGRWELALGLTGAASVVTFILTQRSRLVLALVSADIAHTSGIKVALLDLLYLLAFALTVALGLRYLGVLLMGSLVIIPSATAKHLARSLDGMFAIAVGVAVSFHPGGRAPRPKHPPSYRARDHRDSGGRLSREPPLPSSAVRPSRIPTKGRS